MGQIAVALVVLLVLRQLAVPEEPSLSARPAVSSNQQQPQNSPYQMLSVFQDLQSQYLDLLAHLFFRAPSAGIFFSAAP